MILLSEQCFGLKGNAEGSAIITTTGAGSYIICTYMQATASEKCVQPEKVMAASY